MRDFDMLERDDAALAGGENPALEIPLDHPRPIESFEVGGFFNIELES